MRNKNGIKTVFKKASVLLATMLLLTIIFSNSAVADVPINSNPFPSHNATNVQMILCLNITVNDSDGDLMDINWFTNESGSWLNIGTNSSCTNGTYREYNISWLMPNMTFWWNVSTSDGNGGFDNDTYKFSTMQISTIGGAGWELVSLPKDEIINKSEVFITNGFFNYTWDEAANETIILRFLYYWHTDGYYDETDFFTPYKGHWMYFYDVDYDLWINSTMGNVTVYNVTINGSTPVSNNSNSMMVINGGLASAIICGCIFIKRRKKNGLD